MSWSPNVRQSVLSLHKLVPASLPGMPPQYDRGACRGVSLCCSSGVRLLLLLACSALARRPAPCDGTCSSALHVCGEVVHGPQRGRRCCCRGRSTSSGCSSGSPPPPPSPRPRGAHAVVQGADVAARGIAVLCLRGGAREASNDYDDSEDDTATGDDDDESGSSRAGAPAYGAGTVEDSYVSRYAAAESCSPKRKGLAAGDTLLTEAVTPAYARAQPGR
jgi:hypothetical protein